MSSRKPRVDAAVATILTNLTPEQENKVIKNHVKKLAAEVAAHATVTKEKTPVPTARTTKKKTPTASVPITATPAVVEGVPSVPVSATPVFEGVPAVPAVLPANPPFVFDEITCGGRGLVFDARLQPVMDSPREERFLEGLMLSIAERGVEEPILVIDDPSKPESYTVLIGHRRVYALSRVLMSGATTSKVNGRDLCEIPFHVYQGATDLPSLIERILHAKLSRTSLTEMSKRKLVLNYFKVLQDAQIFISQTAIAARLGVSQGFVGKVRRDAWDQGEPAAICTDGKHRGEIVVKNRHGGDKWHPAFTDQPSGSARALSDKAAAKKIRDEEKAAKNPAPAAPAPAPTPASFAQPLTATGGEAPSTLPSTPSSPVVLDAAKQLAEKVTKSFAEALREVEEYVHILKLDLPATDRSVIDYAKVKQLISDLEDILATGTGV